MLRDRVEQLLRPACSSVALAAPKRSGNIGVMPSPKVKAIGALVRKTSPGFGPTRCLAKVSQGARTSRWNWTQPLGTPVVPLVKAINAGSSRPVSAGGSGCSEAVRVSSSPFRSRRHI